MKSKSASGDVQMNRESAETQLRTDGPKAPVGSPHPVPATDMTNVQACSLDDPDCEACQ
jgi:hypothetical protein